MLNWLVFCAVVLFVRGQEPDGEAAGCCTPDQWEGYIGELTGVAPRFRRARVFASGIEISYDYNNKKVAETVHFRFMNKSVSVGLIFDFGKQKMYRFLESRQKCKTRNLKATFRRFCIPGTAQKLGSFYFGAGRNKLQVTSYRMAIPKMRCEVFADVTSSGCIPVGETVIGAAGLFKKYMMEVGFANITPGIKDPSVFNPPDFCQSDYKAYEDSHDEEIDEYIVQYIHQRFME
ncbi:ependymin-related protein 1-like [Liolophura sinensis]|uniref:ependymin-related protein 1-like n=1 Tax=Liolophura sinensis TaxID=3198878 RepID=UPI00315988CF